MTIVQALILGIVQGITEFLPISSSAHLAAIPKFLGWPQQPLVFDTTLHLGTLLALLIVFKKDIISVIGSVFKDIFSNGFSFEKYSDNSKLGYKLLIGSIPAGLLGFLLGDFFENNVRSSLLIGVFLIFGSLLMVIAEKIQEKRLLSKEGLEPKEVFKLGIFQSLALFPGVSRSGSTISGGMILGMNREHATKFSFLLSVPIVLAAGIFKLKDSILYFSGSEVIPLVIGFIASFVTALFAIKFLLKHVKNKNLYPFVIYRLVLAGVLFAFAF